MNFAETLREIIQTRVADLRVVADHFGWASLPVFQHLFRGHRLPGFGIHLRIRGRGGLVEHRLGTTEFPQILSEIGA